MNKTCIVLYIYDLLKNGEHFKLEDIEEKFICSKRTAARYLAELRKYFKIFNLPYQIKFSFEEQAFVLLEAPAEDEEVLEKEREESLCQ